MKQFNFESEHSVSVELDERFGKMSRVERSAILAALMYVPLDLMTSHRDEFLKDPAKYDAMRASCEEKLNTARAINDALAGGKTFDDLTPSQQTVTPAWLGVTSEVTYKARFDKLPFKQRFEVLAKWARGINDEIAAAEKAAAAQAGK